MSLPEIDAERYQQDCARWGAYEDALEVKKDELMSAGGECDPHDVENISEALLNASSTKKAEIEKLLNTDNFSYEELGRKIYCLSFEHWDHEAEIMAEDCLNGDR